MVKKPFGANVAGKRVNAGLNCAIRNVARSLACLVPISGVDDADVVTLRAHNQ